MSLAGPINDELAAWDRDCLLHPTTHTANHARGDVPGRIVTGGKGVHIEDRDGNRFLDAFAALYCVNVGYGRTEIADAMNDQAQKLAYFHAFAGHGNEPAITLARLIMDRAPEHMARVYFGLSGSDANETNVKLAWHYNILRGKPEKRKIISRWRAYHGSGIVSGSMTGLKAYHARFHLPLEGFLHAATPHYLRRDDATLSEAAFTDRLIADLEAMMLSEGPETIAAFIGEPVMGTGGILPPPEGYWGRVQELLDRYDILLISDEVVCGFGRTGSMFGATHYGLKPDFMTIAKGLTSAYAPLSGSVISQRVFDVLMQGSDDFGALAHGWTYSAHPVSCAAGIATLNLVDELGLLGNASSTGPYLLQRLRDAVGSHPNVAEVRGVGLMAAVEFMEDPGTFKWFEPPMSMSGKISAAMLRRGVIARPMPEGDIIGFAPPLCITPQEVDQVVEALQGAVQEVLG
ncbi:aminotransferase [Hoeflea alexandrii]|uniref:Aminotransferase class III-fold pyridoxal phosphate-dependent enzyme n=1 Tax=Hoeflea alexandrii TaxID=288436 RepID=A0ABT1CSW5_9HYPH|nr:aminotransferase [Hoeflea alexandrii]MCO6409294.1 aminotransferase class III-fold pyridoxal phosphate-dependent enzyme [Hoeflea alexandrii]MCY0151895.1 aminotransferase [Hoeflea alexandrii]